MADKPAGDEPISLTIDPGDFLSSGDSAFRRRRRTPARRQPRQRRQNSENEPETWVKTVKQTLPTPPISRSGIEIVREDGVTDRFLCCRRVDNMLRWVTGKAIDEIGLVEAFNRSTETVERRNDEVR